MEKILQFNKWLSIVCCYRSLFILLYSFLAEILAWMPTNCWSHHTWTQLRSWPLPRRAKGLRSHCPWQRLTSFCFSLSTGGCWPHGSPWLGVIHSWSLQKESPPDRPIRKICPSGGQTAGQEDRNWMSAPSAWCLCAVHKLHTRVR